MPFKYCMMFKECICLSISGRSMQMESVYMAICRLSILVKAPLHLKPRYKNFIQCIVYSTTAAARHTELHWRYFFLPVYPQATDIGFARCGNH